MIDSRGIYKTVGGYPAGTEVKKVYLIEWGVVGLIVSLAVLVLAMVFAGYVITL